MENDTKTKLEDYRDSIDNIDAALVFLLSERFKITHKVGLLKAKKNMPPTDKFREAQQVDRLRQLAKDAELDPEFIQKIHNLVVSEVKVNHEKVRNGG